ncbi:hypothetical protein [Rhizobium sp. Root482]|jgi:DNA polymerase-3 subunit gamma/tau|uniref:hypothetical protein n=1 Tax=Rhizobium sp. Root482 TaxID=1736543 RepID=UPI000A79596C|nr:hypothetical protein [Rhizobium sp. Root482]
MFKRSLLISAVAICASFSFVPAQAAPSSAAVSGLASCTGNCVSQAQSLASEISSMPTGPAKDKLLLSLVKAIGTLAITNPAISVQLGNIAATAQTGLSPAAVAAMPFVQQVVSALKAGNPGQATAALGDEGFGDEPAS